jgi:hypothetical protein
VLGSWSSICSSKTILWANVISLLGISVGIQNFKWKRKIAAEVTAYSQTLSLQDWEQLQLGLQLYWLSQGLTDDTVITSASRGSYWPN